tara:strand:+ start:1004 stop:1201 length:198 start_codon:yes stop_codon:yes gene_type:complete
MWFFFVSFLMLNNGLLNQSVVGMFPDEESCNEYATRTIESSKQNPYVQIVEAGCRIKAEDRGSNL